MTGTEGKQEEKLDREPQASSCRAMNGLLESLDLIQPWAKGSH